MASGGNKRKRQQETGGASSSKRQQTCTVLSAADEKAIDAELKRVNDMLQKEETSQKQTWQIGKRLKKLMEMYPAMATQKTIDAFFLWGTALARLASQNEDPTLAEAAADKFQEMHELSNGDDSAMGPVGYSLWASSLLIVATETRQKGVLDQALGKFAQAVEVDGGTTFETHFQYAKALKEGGDLVKFLEDVGENKDPDTHSKSSYVDYYKRALELCVKLEAIYEEESTKEGGPKSEPTERETEGEAAEDSDEEEDEDDDKVFLEDFAEVKLLQAILHGAIENEQSTSASFAKTLTLFEKALEISPGSPDALMELANYVSTKILQHRANLEGVEWEKVFRDIDTQYAQVLSEAGFDMAECHEICVRKDTKQQEEPDEEEIDERVPHLLNSLGKALAAFAVGQKSDGKATSESSGSKANGKQKAQQSGVVNQRSPPFVHAVEVLRAAHHFHDKLGCYPLAWLYAYPGIEDEENCRTWLETAESYGVLDDELQLPDFRSMHGKDWFQKFLTPAEEIDEEDMEGEDGEEDEASGDEDDEGEDEEE
ncbi:hypothetical protein Gpo141_00007208 [Globisporangium polare]